MTNIGKSVLVGLLVLLCCGSAIAAEKFDDSGNGLLRMCKEAIKGTATRENALDIGFCFGFVRAAQASIQIVNMVADPHLRTCIPDEVTAGQMVRVVVKYLEDHPETLHEHAYSATISAMQPAFPCEQPKPKKGDRDGKR